MAEQIISKITDFSFAGVNLKSVPTAYLSEVNRPLTPAMSVEEYKIPNRPGSIIIKNAYKRVEINIKFLLGGDNRPTLLRKLLTPWLKDEAPLIFDDEPDKFYLGQIIDECSIAEREYFTEVGIKILCRPFKYQIHGDARDLITAQATMQTSGATMVTNKDSFASIKAPRTGTINNKGNMTCKPVIRLIGSANLLTIKVMEFACSIADIKNEEVFIDCEKMIVYKSQGTKKINRLGSFAGRFPEIVPGRNDIAFGGNGLKIDVEFIYYNTYVV